jgi:hypothetical protein
MRKSGIAFALLLAIACQGSDTTDPLVTSAVLVTSNPTQIGVDETAQASAIVKDQNGNPLTGKSIVRTSLNQSVATVSSTGLIKGVSPGNATIQGAVDGVTGTATISVIAPVASCSVGPVNVDLPVGGVQVLGSLETSGCIRIASTSTSSQYLVVAANANSNSDAFATFALKSDEGEAIPSSTLLVSPMRVASQVSVAPVDVPGLAQVRFESRLRTTEARDLDFKVAQRSYASRATDPELRKSVSIAIPSVGDKKTFKVPAKFDASGKSLGGSCSNFTNATATVRYISARAIIYTDDASPAAGFTDTDLQEIGTEFDNLIYPTDVDYFGTPLDLDNNSRVIMLYTPLVNRLTEAGSSGFVGGFFFVGDLFPSSGTNSCAQSNSAEIFYLLAPDPSGTINSNIRTREQVRQGTRGTIAHEFQHMINGSEHIRSPLAEHFESVWLDEGLSHFAEDLNGRALKGFNDTDNYTFQQLATNIDDYNAFFFQNFGRFKVYLQNPGPNSPTSQFADSSLADRGAAWALIHYAADQYAPGGNIKQFIKSLVAGPDTGTVNFRAALGSAPFDSVITGWMIANFADDANISGLSSKYTYKTYNMRDNVKRAANPPLPQYPLFPTTVTGTGVVYTGLQARSGSGDYFIFNRPAGGAARTFRLLNSDLTHAASFAGATLIVLRTQ